jgi:hypothetical protein
VERSRSRVASICASSVPSSVSICCVVNVATDAVHAAELCGPGELAGGAGEPGRVVAFERERPGDEDAYAFAGGVRDRGWIAAGGAE